MRSVDARALALMVLRYMASEVRGFPGQQKMFEQIVVTWDDVGFDSREQAQEFYGELFSAPASHESQDSSDRVYDEADVFEPAP